MNGTDYIKYVNIKQGTESVMRFSNGNTLPLVQRPFGFASFSPQTSSERGTWFYHPSDKSFEGIRVTRQPSPWLGDYGAMVILPQTESAFNKAEDRWTGFREISIDPCHMHYYLKRSKCDFQLTPTMYGAKIKISFGYADIDNFLSVLPVKGSYGYEFDKENGILYAYTDCSRSAGCFKAYYAFDFSDYPVEYIGDGHVKVLCSSIELSMAVSYISYEQALVSLKRERDTFENILCENRKIWNEYLGRVIANADEDTLKTFYSCLYRVFLYPHRAHEISSNGETVHFCPYDGKIKSGVRYTDNGFWDTYRTVYPLFTLIARCEFREILEGFIADYLDCGNLPRWTAMYAIDCMPGTHIDSVISCAASAGILDGKILEIAFEGMEKNANETPSNPAFGRKGCEDYLRLGYVPFDKHVESVNLTLDAAYCDYCVSVVADILGDTEKRDKYLERSKNYGNIFDKRCGFMRARASDGSMRPSFSPITWGEDYTEANAWQTTFAVQHDFRGLSELYGGRERLLEKLDELFAAPLDYRVGGYHLEIHEMTEFASGNWGQCAICNQPSFHLPFIYAYFGETEKTNYWVHRLCSEAFSHKNDGFPGDEDNGTTAAWYILACLGKYPINPGKNAFVKFDGYIKDIKIREDIL